VNFVQFHYHRSEFSSQFKSKIGNILAKVTTLRINLNIDDSHDSVKITHSPITLSNLSSINLVSIFRCSSPPVNPVYPRRVDPSVLDRLSVSFNTHFSTNFFCIALSLKLWHGSEALTSGLKIHRDYPHRDMDFLTTGFEEKTHIPLERMCVDGRV
jgi:hypothetical protein